MTRTGPLHPDLDPDGLMEFSVVFSDRSLNHMSQRFQGVMRDLSAMLRELHSAEGIAIVPGGGTCAMEAVARQFLSRGEGALILRNGWFSFRWSQIVEAGALSETPAVVKARRQDAHRAPAPFAPPPVEEVVARIREDRPAVVFAPHVETSAGVILPDDYIEALGGAARDVGALFVLDCIASGALHVDMEALGVDVLVTAPQKGWSAQPCAGVVLLSGRALHRLSETRSSSFALDLARWRQIMEAYEAGGHAYHATLPTDALQVFRDTVRETLDMGPKEVEAAQWALGDGVRGLLEARGIPSVAAEGFGAPGVVVSYTDRPEVSSGKAFVEAGAQIAAGVPLRCDEGEDFRTFRLGLFGLDKLRDVAGTLDRLDGVLDRVFP